jgi:hypothetical protein
MSMTLAEAIDANVQRDALWWKALHNMAWEDALALAKERTPERYKKGKCTLCRGPALACALRHMRGRSCA